ncbi:MAG: P-II family nitrogen regulator, partial [Oscillospiraceae bacterium]
DLEEHGLISAYAGFSFNPETIIATEHEDISPVSKKSVPVERAVPVESYVAPSASGTPKLTNVVIIAKQNKFEALKEAMNEIGVTGMTVTNVLGCGMQKGSKEFYRGVPVEVNLLPKVQVEIAVCKVPVRTVIDTAKSVLYTGHIGDGKIFVYDIENVIKVRTGEEGYDALQDEE